MAKKMMLKVVILVSLLILQLADSQETVNHFNPIKLFMYLFEVAFDD